MAHLSVVYAAILACIAAIAAASSDADDLLSLYTLPTVSSQLVSWRDKALNTSSGAVKVSSSDYLKLVTGNADFAALVLYTAADPKFGCTICSDVTKEFAMAARSYHRAHPVAPAGTGTGNNTAQPAGSRVIFAVCDFPANQDSFALHGFVSVPYVAYFPAAPGSKPLTSFPTEQQPRAAVVVPADRLLAPSEAGMTAASILQLLPEPIPLVRPAKERQGLSILVTVLFAGFAVAVAAAGNPVTVLTSRGFWFLMCLLAFLVGVSGSISTIIRNSPWYGLGKDGKPVVFSAGGQEQYVLEGAAIGGLYLAAATAVIAAVTAAQAKSASSFVRITVVVLSTATFGVLYTRLLALYSAKTPWYQLKNVIPPPVLAALNQATDAVTGVYASSGVQAAVNAAADAAHEAIATALTVAVSTVTQLMSGSDSSSSSSSGIDEL